MSQPVIVFMLVLGFGTGLACGGIFVLAGLGWALVAGSVVFLFLAAVLARGLIRAGV